jgi:hypothetical protein
MIFDFWNDKHWEYYKQPMVIKDWEKLANKINATFLIAFEKN